MTPFIETDRLVLRQFVLDDAAAVFRIQSDPEVMRYTGEPPAANIDEIRQMLAERPIADYARFGFGRWACILKSNGELIGGVGLKYLPELGEVDLGYRLRRDYWGQGFATEAARACVEYGFSKLTLPKIVGLVEPENIASARVLEKAGFTLNGDVEYRGEVVIRYLRLRGATGG
jgi:RimJ/RimL family protein N-acetyltransferase